MSDGTFDYAYDNEGNLVTKAEIATGKVTEFTWDYRNRLVRVQEKSTGGIILSEANYTYDVFDRRIAKTVNGQTLWTVYENNRVALPNQFSPCERNATLSRVWADFDAAGQVVTRYLTGPGPDEMLARWRPGEGTVWYLADRLGSVRDLVNQLGAVVNHIDYSSFGLVLLQTNPGMGDRFLFTGREYDFETGLYYYWARYYDPGLGRFISQDPIGFEAGDPNLYRFVRNSPLINTDPSGLMAIAGLSLTVRQIVGIGVIAALLLPDFHRIITTGKIQGTPIIIEAISWALSRIGRGLEAIFLHLAVTIGLTQAREGVEVVAVTETARARARREGDSCSNLEDMGYWLRDPEAAKQGERTGPPKTDPADSCPPGIPPGGGTHYKWRVVGSKRVITAVCCNCYGRNRKGNITEQVRCKRIG